MSGAGVNQSGGSHKLDYPLSRKLRSADGSERTEDLSEVTLRRATVEDLCLSDRATSDAARGLILLGRLSGLADRDIDRLDMSDLTALTELAAEIGTADEAEEPEYEIVDGRYHVDLRRAVVLRNLNTGAEELLEKVSLRRPNGGDIRATEAIKGTMTSGREMLVRLSGLEKKTVNRIDAEDFGCLMVLIGNFTKRGQRTGATPSAS